MAFGDDAMSAAQIEAWHRCFKGGGESVESDPHSGRHATSRAPESVEHACVGCSQQRSVTDSVKTRS